MESEDKLLLAHTLWVNRDMGTFMDLDMRIDSVAGIGCNNDNVSGPADGSITLSGEYNKHISTISCNILNANQNSLSTLPIEYIPYFYHVFPLHLNSFNRLFGDVINPKLSTLQSCINDLMICFNQIYNLQNQFQYIIDFYYDNEIYFKSTESFKSFIHNVHIGKLLEPYVKILIDSIYEDTTVLTDMISYLKIFINFYNILSSNINNYFKKLLHNIITNQHNEIRYHSIFGHLERLNEVLNKIKSEISLFHDYQSIRLYIYYIVHNTNSIRIIVRELESFKKDLTSIKSSEPGYISQINQKLNDVVSTHIKSYRLTNIEELEPVKWAPKNLSTLRQNMRDILNDIRYYKDQLSTENQNLVFFFNYIPYIITKPVLKLYESISQFSVSSIIGYFNDLKSYPSLQKYIKQITDNISKSKQETGYFISQVNVIIEYIPNLRQKLLRARSYLDKMKYVEYLLDLLKFEKIDSLTNIHDLIDKIRDKSKIQHYINETVSNGFILTQIYSIQWLIKHSNSIDVIKKLISQTLSIINNIISIDEFIKTLNNINSQLNIKNIDVNIIKLKLIIKEIGKLLNEVDLKMIEEIVKNITKLNEIKSFIIKYRNEYLIKIRKIVVNIIGILNLIKSLIERLKCFKNDLENKLECCKSKINELECAIEGVARNFVRCSLQSLSTQLINLNTDNNNRLNNRKVGLDVDNTAMNMYSIMSVMDYGVVVNRLYDSSKKIDNIVNVMYISYGCFCIESFEKNTAIDKSIGDLGIKQYFFRHKSSEEIYKLKTPDEIKRLYGIDLDLNHMCMCMVIKYSFNPQIFNLLYVISYELQMLSTLSRKFTKYSKPRYVGSDVVKIIMVIVDLVHKLCKFVESRYKSYFVVSRDPVYLKCYCTYNDDKNYQMIVSIMLVLSSLMENIWSMDTETLRMTIECLSILISEFDVTDSQNNKSTSNNNKQFYDIIRCLFCPLKFCTLSSKLQLISDLITLSKKVRILDSAIKPYVSKISLTNPESFFNSINNLISNNNNIKEYLKRFVKKYDSINSGKNICGQFNNKCCVLSSNIIIIVSMLISVKITSMLYPGKCQQLKSNVCDFLKYVCNCKDSECCIKELLAKITVVCNGNSDNCNCENLFNKCIELCCDNNCCSGKCPCKQIKKCCEGLKKLCCNSGQNGLCKIIDEMSKCKCTVKKSRDAGCICCKLAIKSILMLQYMFRSNVRIISKNVIVSCKYILEIMDKIKKTNNSQLIIKSIVNNNSRYNKLGITLTKNSYISYPHLKQDSSDNKIEEISMSNWGYDTKYEHDVTSDTGFSKR